MQRNIFALIVGTAITGAAALAACSGGGGSSPSPIAATGNQANGSGTASQASTGSMTLKLTINRNPQSAKRPYNASARAARRGVAAKRKPQYVSGNAQGLQISVSGGGVTKTVYADISSGSPLCSNTYPDTCTITVPTLAASETITATEVDQLPTSPVSGYGTAFPTNSHVLAAATTTATVAGGASITLGLGPVIFEGFDSGCIFVFPSAASDSNYIGDYDYSSNPGRFVVTSGVAQAMLNCILWTDASGSVGDNNATPVPLSDVNGSPEPYTITSSSQHIAVAFFQPTAFASAFPPATPFPTSTVARVPDTSYNFGTFFVYGVDFDGQQPAVSTLVESNNLSATFSPYVTATPYANSETIGVATLTVSPATTTVSISGSPAQITATDYEGTSGLTPYGVVNNTSGTIDGGECIDTTDGTTERASVVAGGSISPTTWQQTFNVTGISSGTCSFVLQDVNTYNYGYQGYGVITPPVTITVTP